MQLHRIGADSRSFLWLRGTPDGVLRIHAIAYRAREDIRGASPIIPKVLPDFSAPQPCKDSGIGLESGGDFLKAFGKNDFAFGAPGYAASRGNGNEPHHRFAVFGDYDFLARQGTRNEAGK